MEQADNVTLNVSDGDAAVTENAEQIKNTKEIEKNDDGFDRTKAFSKRLKEKTAEIENKYRQMQADYERLVSRTV